MNILNFSLNIKHEFKLLRWTWDLHLWNCVTRMCFIFDSQNIISWNRFQFQRTNQLKPFTCTRGMNIHSFYASLIVIHCWFFYENLRKVYLNEAIQNPNLKAFSSWTCLLAASLFLANKTASWIPWNGNNNGMPL